MTPTTPVAENDLMELVRGADALDGHVDRVTDVSTASLLQEIALPGAAINHLSPADTPSLQPRPAALPPSLSRTDGQNG